MKSRRKSKKSKRKSKRKSKKKSYSPTGAIIGITSGYVSIILLLLYFMKKDKDKTEKNVRGRSDTSISNDDAPSPGYKNLIASLNTRRASINIDEEEDNTIYEDSTEYSNKEIIDQFNEQTQNEQIKSIKDYLNNIERDDVQSLIKYIVMDNNLTLTLPIKIQIISENKSYYCIIEDNNNVQIIINYESKEVDKQADYTLEITCNIDTALNLILNVYNSKNRSISFSFNYKGLFSYSITSCFKLYKKGTELSILECAVNKKC